jgi:hypothetical protein
LSRTIDLFIASPYAIDQVAAEIGRLAQLELVAQTDESKWSLDQGGVHAELRAHNYVDDGELRLERYPYALSARGVDKKWSATAPETLLLRGVADALRRDDPTGEKYFTLLVHDLENRDRPPARPTGGPSAGAGDAAPGSSSDAPAQVGGQPAAEQ